jgi:hypothetical protein
MVGNVTGIVPDRILKPAGRTIEAAGRADYCNCVINLHRSQALRT